MNDTVRETSVYRYYDASAILLYVGITARGTTRNFEHASHKIWWPYVARQEVDHYATRPKALAVEKALIQKYRPPFNVQHNPGYEEFRSLYFQFVAAASLKETAIEMSRRINRTLPLTVHDRDHNLIVFRTAPEHAPLASTLFLNKAEPAAIYSPGKGGEIVDVVNYGPLALVHVRCKRPPVEVLHTRGVVRTQLNKGGSANFYFTNVTIAPVKAVTV